MKYFPLFIDTSDLQVLVVGAGDVAARKLALLSRTEANLKVVANNACDEVKQLAEQGSIQLILKSVDINDLNAIQVLYMATSNAEVNRSFSVLAKQRGILVNVVDSPSDCSFITPAIVDRGELQIAISSSGAAPVMVGLIRTRIETWLPQSIAQLISFSAKARAQLKKSLPKHVGLKQFWFKFFSINGLKFDGETNSKFDELLSNVMASNEGEKPENVYFIDVNREINQLSISVLPILQQIDNVIFDVEIPKELNELIRRDASRIKLDKALIEPFSIEPNSLIYSKSIVSKHAVELR